MIKAGNVETLRVNRFTPHGAYLIDELENEVLLPNRYITDKTKENDMIEVFIYHDSEDRLVASTDKPYAMVGEVAQLEVLDCNSFGAFLDWGLPKDLFLPLSNQQFKAESGKWYVVGVYIDEMTGRITATTKLNKLIKNIDLTVKEGDQVEIVLAEKHDLGFRVVVNNLHWGMIYSNQIFQNVRVGDIFTGYITKVTEDNRLDVSLQKQGVEQMEYSADIIMKILIDNGGELSLGDKSSPEEIYDATGLSKKMFKRGVGILFKNKKIDIENTKIKLI